MRHTADEKFRATGETIEEAFEDAAKAFSEIVKGENGKVRHSIEIESESLEALLFDFLDRLIFLQDTEGVAVSHARNMEVEELEQGYGLEADIMVEPITPAMNFTDVKAPTYNEMVAEYREGEGWTLEAVLDI